MSETPKNTVSCENCVGACCRARAVTIPLNEQEVASLRSAGTELTMFLPAGAVVNWGRRRERRRAMADWDADKRNFVNERSRWLKPGYGLYGLESDCGYLQETPDGPPICSVYDDDSLRPGACSELRAGSGNCVDIRTRRGVGMNTEEINLNLIGAALGKTAVPSIDRTRV